MRAVVVLVLLLSLTIGGCGWFRLKIGSPVSAEAVARIVPGETTRAHVEQVLGAPDAVARLGAGDVYFYRYDEGKMNFLFLLLFNWGSVDVKPDRLLVVFDEEGTVANLAYRRSADSAEFRFLP